MATASKLRGQKPAEVNPRLKALLFGEAGIGKTMAAIQMPKPYVIDTEAGTQHYGDIIEKRGGTVFKTTSLEDTIAEVRTLATEKHDYLTLIIDPFTTLWEEAVESAGAEVGTDFGKHFNHAGKSAKRLYSLVSQLDMNVIFSAHSKNLYAPGETMKLVGRTYDGWKKLDYLFDLVFHLWRSPEGKRVATVVKTRLSTEFPDQASFEWSYDNLAERYGRAKLERTVQQLKLATPQQVEELTRLYQKLSEAEVKRLKIDKVIATVDDIEDLPVERTTKAIDMLTAYFNQATAVAG
jgi:hypothetical protein